MGVVLHQRWCHLPPIRIRGNKSDDDASRTKQIRLIKLKAIAYLQEAALRTLGLYASAAQHVHLAQTLLSKAAARGGVRHIKRVRPRYAPVHNRHQPLLLCRLRMRTCCTQGRIARNLC